MQTVRSFVKYWLVVLAWMAVIFTASSDSRSYQHSSRLIAPLLYWLFPHISPHTVDWVVFIARKCAHVTVYSVLALVLWRAVRRPVKSDPRPWSWKQFGVVVFLVCLYACSDEYHQSFVPTRTPAVHDVVIDTLSGAAALLVVWFICFRGKTPRPPPP